jgi:PAS domain S-box-containing protein
MKSNDLATVIPRSRLGLRGLLAAVAFAAALPFVATTLAELVDSLDSGRDEGARSSMAEARHQASRLEQQVAEIRGFLAVASLGVGRRIGDGRPMDELTRDLKALRPPLLDDIAVFDASGRRIASSLPPEVNGGLNVSKRAWFIEAVASRKTVVSLPLPSLSTGRGIVAFGRAVRDSAGEIIGVIDAITDIGRLEGTLRIQGEADGLVRWLDLGGGVSVPISGTDPGLVGAWQRAAHAPGPRAREIIGTVELGGRDWALTQIAIASTPWRVVVAVPVGRPWTTRDFRRKVLALTAALVVSLLIVFFMSRELADPLARLGNGLARLAAGETGVRVRPAGAAEILRLGNDFNFLAGELEQSRHDAQFHADRLAAYLRASSDWLWETDDTMRLSNVTLTRDPGFEPSKRMLLGRMPWEVANAEVEGGWGPVRTAMEAQQPFRDFRCWRINPRGEHVSLRLAGAPFFDAQANFVGYCGVARDETEVSSIGRALEAERKRFASMVAAMQQGVLIVGDDNSYRFANPRACEILGASAEQILGATAANPPWTRRGANGGPVSLDQVIQTQVLASGVEATNEMIVVRADGSEVHVRLHGVPMRDADGQVDSVLVTLEDVSNYKRAKARLAEYNRELERRVAQRTVELTARVDELDEITYTVSHDLRTPLRAIDGYATILADELGGTGGARAAQLLGHIGSNAQLMGGMVDALLDYANLSKRPLLRRAVVVNAVVSEAIALCSPDPRVQFEVEDLGICVADREMLLALWTRLIANAVHFAAPAAAPLVRIESVDLAQGCAWRISDNGEGFDMAFSNQLFRVFQTLGRSGGLGMGLAFVRRIVERHGGRVSAVSRPGEGAAFTFTLGPGESWSEYRADEDDEA